MINVDLSDNDVQFSVEDVLAMGWGPDEDSEVGCWMSIPEDPFIQLGRKVSVKINDAVFMGEVVINDELGVLVNLHPIVEYSGKLHSIELDDRLETSLVLYKNDERTSNE